MRYRSKSSEIAYNRYVLEFLIKENKMSSKIKNQNKKPVTTGDLKQIYYHCNAYVSSERRRSKRSRCL